ncbi:MAG: response regulator [Endomicrobia bacterium]|nr:response regulator [Endomicrobiia bacterium]MDW8055778.1 response regulator [Elusimicrobiota bacterium]
MSTILIVEDDKEVANMLKERLDKEGYTTFLAHTGMEGLKAVNEITPDCITLDIYLPDINGMEVLKKVKQNNTNIVVIVLTSDDVLEKQAQQNHADGFLTKPVNFKKLKSLIETSCKKV